MSGVLLSCELCFSMLTGLSKWDFLEVPAKERMSMYYCEEELREELEAAKMLTRK